MPAVAVLLTSRRLNDVSQKHRSHQRVASEWREVPYPVSTVPE